MINAILIDLDGTLVDSVPALYLVYLKFLESYGHKGSKEEFTTLIGPSIEEIVAILKKKYNLPGDVHELSLMYISQMMLQGFVGTQLFPDAHSVLEAAKKRKIKLGLVTSGTHALVKACLEPLKVMNLFDVVVTSEDAKNTKPHPELYQVALGKLGCQPKEAVAIEDSEAGIKAASGAGLQVIAFTHGDTTEYKEQAVALSSWKEIGAWLKLT